jgi:hypothetical protein
MLPPEDSSLGKSDGGEDSISIYFDGDKTGLLFLNGKNLMTSSYSYLPAIWIDEMQREQELDPDSCEVDFFENAKI